MASNTSILNDIKQSIGIVPECNDFDPRLIPQINSVFATLHQIGYGPAEGYEIEGEDETWDDIIKSRRFNFVKSYIMSKVHTMFDPPTSSIALEQLNKEVAEYEWRIKSEVECYGEED